MSGYPQTAIAPPAEPATDPRRWWTLGVLCLSLVLIVMDNTILNVALPTLVKDLGATTSQLQWIVDAYTLVFAGLLLAAGSLGDRFGRKGALSLGLTIFASGSVAATFAGSASALIAARAFMGIGGALIMPATLSILTNVFRDPRERAKAIGIWAAASGIGVVIGPVTGGWLLEHFSWHSVFWVNVPFVGIALLAGRLLIPPSKDPNAPRLDLVGVGLSIAGLVSLVWAIIEAPTKGWTSIPIAGAFMLAVMFLGGLISWELRSDHPMLDMRFFRNPRFSAANGAITLTFFALFGSMFLLSQYLQSVKGYTPLQAGVRMVPWALVMMIVSPMSARLVQQFGTKLVVTSGLTLTSVGLFWMASIDGSTTFAQLFARMAVMAAGMGLVMGPATESVMGSLPPEKAGVGSAMNDTTRELGGALGVAVIGSIVSSVYKDQLGHQLAGLPAQAAATAKESLGAALQVAGQSGGSRGAILAHAARTSFVDGLGTGLRLGAGVALVAAAIAFVFLPAQAKAVAVLDEPSDENADYDLVAVG